VTVHFPATVLELLDLNPHLKVYQYVRTGTGHQLYAVFEAGGFDDMDVAQDVTSAVLLCENGRMTPAGRAWVVAHGRKGM
jgi:hypothetical protein